MLVFLEEWDKGWHSLVRGIGTLTQDSLDLGSACVCHEVGC